MISLVQLRSEARFPQVAARQPHYESFYLKTASPDSRRALWIRHTVLKASDGPPTGSLWLTLFDADGGPIALKASHPADELAATPQEYIRIGDSRLAPGIAVGEIDAGEEGSARWELRFEALAPAFYYLPRDWMYRRSLPKTKAISLYPSVTFSGSVNVRGRQVDVGGWPGMIGHNWGSEHAHRSSWIQAAGFAEEPDVYLDAVLARIKLGPVITPWIGNGCLFIEGRTVRLGGPGRGATSMSETPTGATFGLRGEGVTVSGEVSAPAERFVAWRYGETTGGWHPTLNCSLADMRLRVELPSGARELSVRGGAAYELQLREHDHGIELQPFGDP